MPRAMIIVALTGIVYSRTWQKGVQRTAGIYLAVV